MSFRLFRILFICACAFLCFRCTSSKEPSAIELWAAADGKIKVLSTTAMINDIVSQLGGDRIDCIPLITGEIYPHNYELVKGDDEKLQMAQLVFYNGLGLEHGASLRYQLEHHKNSYALGNEVLNAYPELILHSGKEIDPHIWMDISLWSKIIDPIVKSFVLIDPEGEAEYVKNANQLLKKMKQAHEDVFSGLQAIPQEKRYLVTSHDAFNYFARAYLATPEERKNGGWIPRCEAPEGLAPEGQLSAADIQNVIDHLIRYHIQVVFPESNVSRDSLKKIVHACAQKGLHVLISSEPLYGDAMGPKESDADSYIKMIQHNSETLIRGWRNG